MFSFATHPVVHVVAHHVGIEQIAVADLHPDANRLRRAVRDEALVEFPRAVRRLGVRRPLLVHVGAGVGQHAVIQLRVIPRHDQRRRSAGAAAHRRAPFGILRQLHVAFAARRAAALPSRRTPRSVPTSCRIPGRAGCPARRRCRCRSRCAIIAGTRFCAIRLSSAVNSSGSGPSAPTMNGAAVPGTYCFRDVDGDPARVRRRMAGRDHQLGGIGGIGGAERAGVARDARIDLAVGRAHREVADRCPAARSSCDRHFRRGLVRRTDDEIAVGVGRRHGAVGQLLRGDVSRRVRIARRRNRPRARLEPSPMRALPLTTRRPSHVIRCRPAARSASPNRSSFTPMRSISDR